MCGALKIENCSLTAHASDHFSYSALTTARNINNRIWVWSFSAKLDGKGYARARLLHI